MDEITSSLQKLTLSKQAQFTLKTFSIATEDPAFANDKIFMHPNDLKRHKLSAMDWLLVDGKWIFRCWPDLLVEREGTAKIADFNLMHSPDLKSQKSTATHSIKCTVLPQGFASALPIAKQINIRLSNNLPLKQNSQIINAYLQEYLKESQFVFCAQIIRLEAFDVVGEVVDINANSQPATYFRMCPLTSRISIVSPVAEAIAPSTIDLGGLDEQLAEIKQLILLPDQYPSLFSVGNGSLLNVPKGVLLYGAPGTGKTQLARKIAADLKWNLQVINGPEVIGKYLGETEERLRAIFQEAASKAPSLIFIDEIDTLCPKREEATSGAERRIVASLLTLMDGLSSTGLAENRIFVLAATNRPHSIDSALRRPGRFDREVEIPIPTALQRLDIMKKLLSKVPNAYALGNEVLEEVCAAAHGYVGADLAAVCKEAALYSLQRAARLERIGEEQACSQDKAAVESSTQDKADLESNTQDKVAVESRTQSRVDLESRIERKIAVESTTHDKTAVEDSIQKKTHLESKIENKSLPSNSTQNKSLPNSNTQDDLLPSNSTPDNLPTQQNIHSPNVLLERQDLIHALTCVKASAMREITVQIPKVNWQDIGGQQETKQRLKESVEWPLKHPEAFLRLGIQPPKGVLLYGPPGCSKTLMAKALATEAKLNFIPVKGPELFNKWVGESEKAIKEVFRKARAASPSIIFFDEIDAIGSKRAESGENSVQDRVLSMLLNEMDGIEPLLNVTIVAATNRPDILDSALLRPGRFDRLVYVAPPDLQARREILNICARKTPMDETVSLEELAVRTDGFSGAELVAVCQEAAIRALHCDLQCRAVQMQHFEWALAKARKGITPEMLSYYENYASGTL